MSDSFDFDVFDGVYSPMADTYLLLDAISVHHSDFILDVGCGVGLASLVAASKGRRVVSIDISFLAVRNTQSNLKKNGLVHKASVVQTDLFEGFSDTAKFSVIMFNPPYLPADDMNTEMDHALIGGEEGSELTERFIKDSANHIVANGRLYVVISTLANREAIIKAFNDNNFQVEQVNETQLFFEKIQVLKGTFKGHKEIVL